MDYCLSSQEGIMPTSSNHVLASHGFFQSTVGQLVFFGAGIVVLLVFALSHAL